MKLFRVTLPNIKGFFRLYAVDENEDLYHFHRRMALDMEFPSDQIVLMKGFDANGALVGKFATFDIGSGSLDKTTVADIVAKDIVSFEYFYDTTNRRSVILTLEGDADKKYANLSLVDVKGPNPIEFINGFVAIEDLPVEKRVPVRSSEDADEEDLDEEDDIDEDEDEEEDDGDEDGKEIVDESEL